MSDVKRALIVGCGIGGATAAYTLARAGINVHCVDIAPKSSAAGTGICLLHNTLRALNSVELDVPCIESGLLFEKFRQFDAAGNQTAVNPTPPGIGIRRPDLARTLESAAINAGATIQFGVTVTDLNDRGNRVDVTFSNGTRGEYDIVVAADGATQDEAQSVRPRPRARVRRPERLALFGAATARTRWVFPVSRQQGCRRRCYSYSQGHLLSVLPGKQQRTPAHAGRPAAYAAA